MMRKTGNDDAGEARHGGDIARAEQKGNIAPVPLFSLDYVSAHMLFNLAAMRGSTEAKIYRKELSAEMDPAEVADAQRQARQWLAAG
ncbi:MAG: hypothetical protein Q8L23_14795 [Caulobacter sp.]|nr:hypothetical protein [Caulobacter sp.]